MINRTNLIIINLNQSFSLTEIQQKKEEKTRWFYFSFITLTLLGNLLWFIHLNMDINKLIKKLEYTEI